jgi:hypothetical protein
MMKKVLSILVSILFSLSVIAFAQETPTKTPPTATGGAKIEKKSESVKTTKTKKKIKKTKKVKKTKKTKKTKQESQQ